MAFHCNFGSIGLLDWLHGTDKQYRQSGWDKYDRMFISVKPLDEE